jgi:branched-chain amino acid transport system substrate-binding protein
MLSKGWIRLLTVLAVLALAAVATTTALATRQQSSTIKIGVLSQLTGGGSAIGVPFVDGARFAEKEINDAGGVNGRKVELVISDNQTQPTAGLRAALKLVDSDDVKVVACMCYSTLFFPIAQALKNKGVVLTNNGATPPTVRTLPGSIVTPNPLDDVLNAALAKYVYGRGFKSVALLSPNDAYGVPFRKSMKKEWAKLGGKLVADVVVKTNLPDYSPELQRIVDANPRAVISGTYVNDLRLQFKQITQLGWKGLWFMPYPTGQGIEADPDPQGRAFGVETAWLEKSAWKARFVKSNKKQPSYWTALGYDNIRLMALAMSMPKGDSASGILRNVRVAGSRYRAGPSGKYSFDKDHVRSNAIFGIYAVKGGKVVRTGTVPRK